MYSRNNIFAANNYSNTSANNSSYRNNYNSNDNQQIKLGSYRLEYRLEEPPSYLTSIISQWKQYPPHAIVNREQTLHLTTTELRIEDYYLIRTKQLKNIHNDRLNDAIRNRSFNQQLLSTQPHNLPPVSFQNPVDINALRGISGGNSAYYNSNNSNSYSNSNMNRNNIFTNNDHSNNNIFSSNRQSNNLFSSNNNNNSYNSGNNSGNIFTRNSGSNNNIFMSNNGNSSNNIFTNGNRASNNIFGNNSSSNNGNHGSNNMFNSQSNNNIFSNQNNQHNNNIFSNNGGNSNNIFNRNSNNNNSNNNNNNMFSNTNGNNIFNGNNNSNIFASRNNNNIFNNNHSGNGNSNNFFNNSNSNSNNIFSNSNNLFRNNNNNNIFHSNQNNDFYNNQNQNNSIFNPLSYLILQQQKLLDAISNSTLKNQPTLSNTYQIKPDGLFEDFPTLQKTIQIFQRSNKPEGSVVQLHPIMIPIRKSNKSEVSSSKNSSIFENGEHKMTESKTFRSNLNQSNSKHQQRISSSTIIKNTKPEYASRTSYRTANSQLISNFEKSKDESKGSQIKFIDDQPCILQMQIKVIWECKDKQAIQSWIWVELKKDSFEPCQQFYRSELLKDIKTKNKQIRSDGQLTIQSVSKKQRKQNKIIYRIIGQINQKLINIESGYIFSYTEDQQFTQNFNVHKLRLENSDGQIQWQQPVTLKYIDFKEIQFSIKKSQIECDCDYLNKECIVTFNELPEFIKKYKGDLNKIRQKLSKKINSANKQYSFLDLENQSEQNIKWKVKINKFY